jgi:uncharacterized protein
MTTTTTPPAPAIDVPPAPDPPARRRRTGARTAPVLVAALAVLLGLGGRHPSGVWQALVALAVGGAALVASRWRSPRGGAWALLGLGVVGLVAGLGMGAPQLVRTGASPAGVAGAVTIVAATLLVVLAATALIRATRRWWRLLALPIGLGVLALVVAPVAAALLVTQVPPLELGDDRPADHGLVAEDVTVRTADGMDLAAWYVPSSNGAAVVLLPGAGSTRDEELDHAEVLARHGYGVLLLDVRGHGGSEGEAMLWGWDGDADVGAAVTWLLGRPDVVDGRVGVVGMSMGGEQAITAAGSDARIRAVVAEGATAQGPSDVGTQPSGPFAPLERAMAATMLGAVELLTPAERPRPLDESIALAAPRPVLVIAAGELGHEVTAGRAFVAAAPASVELWVVPGSGHTGGLDTDPAGWEARVTGFLDRAL